MSRSWAVRRGGARQAGRALAGSSVMYLHWIRFYPEATGLGCVVYLHILYVLHTDNQGHKSPSAPSYPFVCNFEAGRWGLR